MFWNISPSFPKLAEEVMGDEIRTAAGIAAWRPPIMPSTRGSAGCEGRTALLSLINQSVGQHAERTAKLSEVDHNLESLFKLKPW